MPISLRPQKPKHAQPAMFFRISSAGDFDIWLKHKCSVLSTQQWCLSVLSTLSTPLNHCCQGKTTGGHLGQGLIFIIHSFKFHPDKSLRRGKNPVIYTFYNICTLEWRKKGTNVLGLTLCQWFTSFWWLCILSALMIEMLKCICPVSCFVAYLETQIAATAAFACCQICIL